jgi:hypothetical protein
MFIRSLGAVLPSRPKADAGIIVGAAMAAAATAVFLRHARLLELKLVNFFCIAFVTHKVQFPGLQVKPLQRNPPAHGGTCNDAAGVFSVLLSMLSRLYFGLMMHMIYWPRSIPPENPAISRYQVKMTL